ncbi:MAG: glycosyltransferase family 4 protein [Pseudomonadota bacterium]
MRLSLVIYSMHGGGAERVMKLLADAWADQGHELTLITLAEAASDFFRVDQRVRRVGLGLLADSPGLIPALRNNLARLRGLRRELKAARPRVIISFGDATNVLAVLAARGLGAPVVVCEHTDPHHHQVGRLWSGLRRLVYPLAQAVVGVSPAAEEYVKRFVKHRPVLTIPNPIQAPRPQSGPPLRPWPLGPTVMGMGRLHPSKGFDLLLRAFAACQAAGPQWRLVILGEGPERPRLEALALELGIAQRVHLPGQVAEPAALLRQAEFFVMSSSYEGFPMALAEAMSCGLAVVATDCSAGVRQIVRPGVDGLLVPPGEPQALAQAMLWLMQDPAGRARLAAQAPQVVERFGLKRVLEQWQCLFNQLGVA